MAKDSMISITPPTPLSPLSMQNVFWETKLLSIRNLQVIDSDLQIDPAAGKRKRGGVKFGRPEMTSGVIGRSHALTWNPHKVGVHFSVRVLVVKDRYGVGAGSDAGEL